MMSLDAREIQEIIPHRPPILLIDRILELDPGQSAVGLKNVSEDDWFFHGHFPGNPVMPGVLIVEALAQVGAVAILALPENRGKLPYFAAIDGVRFRRPVRPGDALKLEVGVSKLRKGIGKGTARALVDDVVVTQGELTFVLVEPPE
jgi:3-hydroxyacyl-[acyl-carrier-protein] dehydratase